jgi:4'-phosphopantetheinyl transferase
MSLARETTRAPADGVVHLWRVNLREWAVDLAEAAAELSPPELARAGRLLFEHDRALCLAGRAWLRRVLGGYLGRPAREVALTVDAHGKPRLCAARHPAGPRFSLSHCGDAALLAVSARAEVGVDVEAPLAEHAWPAVARRCCTPGEWDALRELPAAARSRAFAEIWTRKEALAKALGTGLTDAVLAESVGPAAWGAVRLPYRGVVVRSLPAVEGLAAALALVERTKWGTTSERDALAVLASVNAVRCNLSPAT